MTKRGFQETGVQHADALAVSVGDGLVGRDVPIVDDEGIVDPGVAPLEHAGAHHLRYAGAQRTLPRAYRHVGADTHVTEEQGDGAEAPFRQTVGAVNQVADAVY